MEEIKNWVNDCESCEKKLMKNRDINGLTISNSLVDGVYVINKKGVVIYVNEEFTNITGISKSKIIGKRMKEIWNNIIFISDPTFLEIEQKNENVKSALFENRNSLKFIKPKSVGLMVLQEKRPITVLTTISKTNKKVLITGTPFLDTDGNVTEVLTVIKDLTEVFILNGRLEEIENNKKKYLYEFKNINENQNYNGLISNSIKMKKVTELIGYVAKTDVTILITGETGVGKEVVSRNIVENSKRYNKPYIKVNCAAIPETLLESELFGYEKGAFTGASNNEKLGLFEQANNGTILLDEIGEIPFNLQAKLLRVLQEKEIKRVGGTNTIKIDVRVIAATNQKLEEEVRKGNFREDLFYRLNVIPITIPPLRERKEDISYLANNFLEKFNKLYNKNKELDIEAIEILESYSWPGNVRELENAIERLLVIGDNKYITKNNIISILGKEKFEDINEVKIKSTLKEIVDDFEKDIIEKTLKECGNTYKAAEVLGITQSTVVRKAKALGITNW